MTQNLVVSGKEYLPSAEIAQSFGYTSDYVSRLARERKVIATNINRKWFVNPESFKEFVRDAHVGKETRSDELKKERKVERMLHAREVKRAEIINGNQVHIAVAQSLAVLMCGAFVGMLGWSVSGTGVSLAELTTGFEKTYIHIADAVTPNQNPFTMFSKRSGVASVQESVSKEGLLSENVGKGTMHEHSEVSTVSQDAAQQYNAMNFSDPVDVRFVEDGTGSIRPVFKNPKTGQEYEMVVAPVTGG